MRTASHVGIQVPARRISIDWSQPVFLLLALVLAVLVILPLAWLVYYSITDVAGNVTLANFKALVTDPTLRRPFVIAIIAAFADA